MYMYVCIKFFNIQCVTATSLNLIMVPAENKTIYLSLIKHTPKTIHNNNNKW